MVPPTPDGFDFLDEDPNALAVCGLAGTAKPGVPVDPLLRTPSEELDDVLGGAGGSLTRSHRRPDPLAAVLDGASLDVPSPVSSCRSEGLWEANSPDPLADVERRRAAAACSPAARRDAAHGRPGELAPEGTNPPEAAAQSVVMCTSGAVRSQRPDPLAGIIEAAPDDVPEKTPPRRLRQRASSSQQPRSQSLVLGKSAVHVPDAEEADLDAALRSCSRKRAAAALDAAGVVDGPAEELLAGGSLPASPGRWRVTARPAAATRSISSLRSFACGRAKT